MRVFKMRQKLALEGLVLLQHGEGFKVTDGGVKTPFEKDFPNLHDVENWFKKWCTNRLTDLEAEQWDHNWVKWLEEQK